jgi:lipopolysaccharide heptosyltransferase II
LNILLVRLRLIGDVVFTTPLIRALRLRHSAARLAYLVEESAAPVVADNPHLDDVITVPHSRGWRRLQDDLRVARMLRGLRFDVAIDLHGGPRSAWFTWASRAAVRVGYDVPGRSWMYTQRIPRPREFRPRHAVENQWDLLAAFDASFARPATRFADPVEMRVTPETCHRADHRRAGLGVPADGRLTVMHVSAGNPFRRWPESSFSDVAAAIVGVAPDSWVMVTAGPSDRAAALRVVAGARERARDAATRIVEDDGLTLGDLRGLLENASLFIGGDSGPLHIAATSPVPIVALYGPTLPVRSAPWRSQSLAGVAIECGPLPCRPCDQRVCLPGDFRCLTRISAAQVIEAARRLLLASRPAVRSGSPAPATGTPPSHGRLR